MRRIAAIAAVIVTAGLLPLTGAGVAHATNVGNYICLTNHATSCLDVKDDSYTLGQQVWIFSDSSGSGANALGWNPFPDYYPDGVCAGQTGCGGDYFPFTDHAYDRTYYGDVIYLISPNINNTCLALGESGGAVSLRDFVGNCTGNTNFQTVWVKDGNNFINVERTNYTGVVSFLTALGTGNGAAVDALPAGTLGGWTQWTISGYHS